MPLWFFCLFTSGTKTAFQNVNYLASKCLCTFASRNLAWMSFSAVTDIPKRKTYLHNICLKKSGEKECMCTYLTLCANTLLDMAPLSSWICMKLKTSDIVHMAHVVSHSAQYFLKFNEILWSSLPYRQTDIEDTNKSEWTTMDPMPHTLFK